MADVPDEIVGDWSRLQQVLTNLVGNAIKFTAHGHVAVRLDLLERTPTTATLPSPVTDTGIGIRRAGQPGNGAERRLRGVQPEAKILVGERRVHIRRLVPVRIPPGADLRRARSRAG